jgi:hypothetical protein
MLRAVGRLLQFFGLIILPLAMVLEISGSLDRDTGLSDMLIMLMAGGAAFLLGRFIEGYAPQ